MTPLFPQGPKDAADPAQDPNNQGEDEFEEAELERPGFEEKTDPAEQTSHQTNRPAHAASQQKLPVRFIPLGRWVEGRRSQREREGVCRQTEEQNSAPGGPWDPERWDPWRSLQRKQLLVFSDLKQIRHSSTVARLGSFSCK